MELKEFVEKLQNRLKNNLPGKKEQWRMGVQLNEPYNFEYTGDEAIQSSVLILLYQKEDDICFVLTERTEKVEHHRGQISLPGGARENNEMLSATAVRETQEEIGINAKEVEIIGTLTPLFVPVTGFIINPFVGVINSVFDPYPAPNEVANVFSVTLSELLDDDNKLQEKRNLRGYNVNIPYYLLSGYKVWGATAMILSELKTIISEIKNVQN